MRVNKQAEQTDLNDEQMARENLIRLEVLLDLFRRGVMARLIKQAQSCVNHIVQKDLRQFFQTAKFHVGIPIDGEAADRIAAAYIGLMEASVDERRALIGFKDPINFSKSSKNTRRIAVGWKHLQVLDRVLDPMAAYRYKDSVYPMIGAIPTYFEARYNSRLFSNSNLKETINALFHLVSSMRYALGDYSRSIPAEAAFLKLDALLAPHVEDYWHDLITVDRATVAQIVAGEKPAALFASKVNGCGTISEHLESGKRLELMDWFKQAEVLVVVGKKSVLQTRLSGVFNAARALS